MFFTDILNPEVVDYQCEPYWSPFVFPKSWHELALVVAVIVESFV
jgi:hypothetical protein